MITEVPGPTPLPDGMELRRDVAKGHALSQEDLGELRTLSRGDSFIQAVGEGKVLAGEELDELKELQARAEATPVQDDPGFMAATLGTTGAASAASLTASAAEPTTPAPKLSGSKSSGLLVPSRSVVYAYQTTARAVSSRRSSFSASTSGRFGDDPPLSMNASKSASQLPSRASSRPASRAASTAGSLLASRVSLASTADSAGLESPAPAPWPLGGAPTLLRAATSRGLEQAPAFSFSATQSTARQPSRRNLPGGAGPGAFDAARGKDYARARTPQWSFPSSRPTTSEKVARREWVVGAKNLGLVQTWRPPTPAPVETPKSFRIEEACGEQVNSRRRSAHGTSFTASRSDRFGEIGVGERTDARRQMRATLEARAPSPPPRALPPPPPPPYAGGLALPTAPQPAKAKPKRMPPSFGYEDRMGGPLHPPKFTFLLETPGPGSYQADPAAAKVGDRPILSRERRVPAAAVKSRLANTTGRLDVFPPVGSYFP